jgi:hypothetical protein
MTGEVITIFLLLVALTGCLAGACRWFYKKDNNDDGWRFGVALFLGIAAVLALLIAIIFPASVVVDAIGCRNKAANLELPHRFSISAGCYVQFHGQWIGIDKALGIVAQ